MNTPPPLWVIGLMSGTSLDGLDAALLRTDGVEVTERGPWLSLPFDAELKHSLQQAVRQKGDIPAIERAFTLQNAQLVKQLLAQAGMTPDAISLIGFHGQTILHRPEESRTWQIGDAALLAAETGIDVVADFRSADMRAGGQGAPLVPLYHAALTQDMERPVAVLNIGGIANVTWVGEHEQLLAFDTGPGNVLLNAWMQQHTEQEYDENGQLAQTGTVNDTVLETLMTHPFFHAPPPKSLDRHDFTPDALEGLSAADGAATLAAFTAEAIAQAQQHLPAPPQRWLVAGGGRHNAAIMEELRARLTGEVLPVEAAGWEGDALEAQAFAYLAVRSQRGLPLTLPSTTGVSCAATGGVFYPASPADAPPHR